MTTPRVSVVMAVHNGERYLEAAVESILSQTFRDFEFLIVDDASTDGTAAMLERFAAADPRIRVLRNDRNLGLTLSLNRALEIARAPIIARMDADDISLPHRLERQVAFLDAHPDHILVATSYRAINGQGATLYVKRKPADDFCVQWWLRFRMCLEHPSTCFRAQNQDGTPVRYDERYAVAQDYELFSRLSRKAKMAVLPQVLFNYRVHDANITSTRRREQKTNVLRIAQDNQCRTLEPRLVRALDPLMRNYMMIEPSRTSDIRAAVAAMREIIRQDTAKDPDRRTWVWRQASEVLAHAMLVNGGGSQDLRFALTFAFFAWRFLPSLVMRTLENKNVLPVYLESHPRVDEDVS